MGNHVRRGRRTGAGNHRHLAADLLRHQAQQLGTLVRLQLLHLAGKAREDHTIHVAIECEAHQAAHRLKIHLPVLREGRGENRKDAGEISHVVYVQYVRLCFIN